MEWTIGSIIQRRYVLNYFDILIIQKWYKKMKRFSDCEFEIYYKKFKDFTLKIDEKWAIYGTGVGAEIVFEILCKENLLRCLYSVIDQDKNLEQIIDFHGFKVVPLRESFKEIDGIIIASMDYHEEIEKRIEKFYRSESRKKPKIINLFAHSTVDEIRQYTRYIESVYNQGTKKDFIPYDSKGVGLAQNDTKVIAWYLPQFHRIDINDKYYGRGFTEWSNVATTIPMFCGHYQPHVPIDLGYYNLNDPDVFPRQIELAKHYGISGFSFYYYWFSGQRIMEKPLYYYHNHPELDMKYCFTWANENWSALWDGGDKDLIFEQHLEADDDKKFVYDLLPFLSDKRYIRINNKALLIIYRPNIWSKKRFKLFADNIRNEAIKCGVGDFYIGLCNARGFDENVSDWGADALIEFPPHQIYDLMPYVRIDGYLNPNFVGRIKDTSDFIKNKLYLMPHNSMTYYRGAMPYWDNTARKAYSGAVVYKDLTPETFCTWLTDIIAESKKIHSEEENIVFVNAWNEWAEGSHLEPDERYGYANLSAVKRAILCNRNK